MHFEVDILLKIRANCAQKYSRNTQIHSYMGRICTQNWLNPQPGVNHEKNIAICIFSAQFFSRKRRKTTILFLLLPKKGKAPRNFIVSHLSTSVLSQRKLRLLQKSISNDREQLDKERKQLQVRLEAADKSIHESRAAAAAVERRCVMAREAAIHSVRVLV